jgi:hypothetical protein
MKKVYLLLQFFAILFFSCQQKTSEKNWESLFNGSDLTGWDTYLGPAFDSIKNDFDSLSILGLNNDPNKVFTVVT